MQEQYQWKQMRVATEALTVAQNALESMVIKGNEETIFDYRDTNPELYKVYMEINSSACKLHDMTDL